MRQPSKAVLVDDVDTADQAGAFQIRGLQLRFRCPGGCGEIHEVELDVLGGEWPKRWWWNGDRERPTLSGHLHAPQPQSCGWHGFLHKGEWRPTGASLCFGVEAV